MSLLDVLVIILVFGLTAYVGYRSSKNVKNIDDFTLAGSRLGKIQAGFSMAATEFGGSSLIGKWLSVMVLVFQVHGGVGLLFQLLLCWVYFLQEELNFLEWLL